MTKEMFLILDRGLLFTRKLLNQRFLVVKLNSSLQKFYICHHDLVMCHKWPWICFACCNHNPILSSWLVTGFVTRVTRRVTLVEQELLTLQKHSSSSHLVLSGVSVAQSIVFRIVFCRSLLVLLFFFFQ
jgi:hypothetical protein